MRHVRMLDNTYGRESASNFLKSKIIPVTMVLVMLLWGAYATSGQGSFFTTSEMKFVDTSVSGLLIVPASCPSYPHGGSGFDDLWDGGINECSPPTCSVWVDTNPINQPGGTYLRWTSSNATSFYISNIGYVTPNTTSNSWVVPSQSTSYDGSVENLGSSGNCGITLYVNRSCSWHGHTVLHGQSVTAYNESSVPFGQSCASQTRTCNDGSLSGSYAYNSCSVQPPGSCTLDGVAVPHGSSYTFYSAQTVPSGELCSTYAESRSCYNGSLSGSSSYQYASCSCTPSTVYSCGRSGGSTVKKTTTDAACQEQTTWGPICTSPGFCSAGSAVCLYPSPSFISGGGKTGHLQADPSIVRQGETTQVFWDVSNVSSCSVSSSPESGNWSGVAAGCDGASCSAGASGQTSGAVLSPTTFSLSCTGLDGSSVYEETSVLIIPVFQET